MRWTAGLLLLATTPAVAQNTTYFVETGGWVVMNGTTNCQAFNRKPIEFNVAPYNALNLRWDAGAREGTLYLMYWPGAFAPNQQVTVTFDYFGRGDNDTMPGIVEGDFIVKLDGKFDGKALQAMERDELVTVSVDGMAAKLAFETSALADVGYHLESCAAALKAK